MGTAIAAAAMSALQLREPGGFRPMWHGVAYAISMLLIYVITPRISAGCVGILNAVVSPIGVDRLRGL